MGSFIFWRMIKLVVTTFVVLTLVFVAFRLVPGNPAQLIAGMQTQADVARVKKYLGLDDPIQVQYLRYIEGLLHGQLGVSFIYQQQVGRIILSRLPATLWLLLASILLTILIGIPVGVLAAVKQGTLYDYTAIGLVVATL